MVLDIRAHVYCSLGTVISGSFADDYLQGNGLIKTRGEVLLAGTQTPAVGTEVTFTYTKGGSTYTIPRVLRVLSSFADPFRRITTVQLGCKLTYLENRKPPVEDPNARDEHSDVPCRVFLMATLPISAEYVFEQCLDALELTSAAIPLTSTFSVEEFDLTPGYLQVMSDLLQSEGYAGYLDNNETLQFIDLTVDSVAGPILTPNDIIDLGPIGVGELPGESVVVRFNSLRLLPPDQLYGDDYLRRNWEIEEVFGAPSQVSVSYTNDESVTVSDSDVFYPYSFTATRYDVWDRKIESISLNLVSSAETNNRWASDALRAGRAWNLPTAKLVREVIEYQEAAAAANSVDLMSVQQAGNGVGQIKASLASAAGSHNGLASLCAVDVPDGADVVLSQTTYNYFSELELAGSLNIDTYIDDSGSLQQFDTVAGELDSAVIVEYETDDTSGISKTITKRSISRSQTVSGQQDLATRAQDLDTADLNNSISSLLALARRQVYVGAETSLHTQRQYGLQRRPRQQDRNNTANERPVITEQRAEIAWVTGSTTSTAVTEFTVPYAPDDEITWDEETGEFTSTPSDARQKALRYGRIQNRLLLGNRSGISLQLAPEQLPGRPFDLIYLLASGITGAYRVNGTSWAFDANGIVASTDALFWGAVSAEDGTDLSESWIPLAPGTTSLPAPYPATSGGLDSSAGVTYGAVITPTTVLPPYIESVLVQGLNRSTAVIRDYPYALDRGSTAAVLVSRSSLVIASTIAAELGSFALSGQVAALKVTKAIKAAAGSVALSGYGAGSIRDYRIGTNYGSFTLSGQNAIVAFQRAPLAADAASFALGGQAAQFSTAIRFAAEAGSYGLSGQAAASLRGYLVGADQGTFSVTGQDATLTLPPPPDPYASEVVLLLHMDGSNGSTAFVDSSSYSRTVTAYNNAQITTAQSKFGGASALFDGINDYLSVADSAELNLGASNFTIEAWVRLTTLLYSAVIAGQGDASNANRSWDLTWTPPNQLVFGYTYNGFTQNTEIATWVPTANTWYHVAVTRQGNLLRMFVDGVLLSTDSVSTSAFYNSTSLLRIGARYSTVADDFTGYLDDLRITIGTARYTANFTPPNAAFPDPPIVYSFPADAGSFTASGQDANFNYVSPLAASLLYTGTAANQSITGAGFKPGFLIINSADAASSTYVFDQRRGSTSSWNWTASSTQSTSSSSVTSFDSDGFSLGTNATYNGSGLNYVALALKEGGASTTNTDGSITTTVNANDAAGYSIFNYTGNATSGATVGHGLSAAPELVFVRNHISTGFQVIIGSSYVGADKRLSGTSTAIAASDTNCFQSFDASTLTFGTYTGVNAARQYVAYAFRSTDVVKVGLLEGNGVDTLSTSLGFRPAFIYIKASAGTAGNHWFYFRQASGDGFADYFTGNSTSDVPGTSGTVSITSTGFSVAAGGVGNVASGDQAVYLAVKG